MSTKQDRISGNSASRASPHSNLSRSDLENLRSLFEPLRVIENEEQPKKDHADNPKDSYLLPIHPAPSSSSAISDNDFQDVNYEVPMQLPETFGSKRNNSPTSFDSYGTEMHVDNQDGKQSKAMPNNEGQIYGTYDRRKDYHRRSDRNHRREQEYRNEVANAEERLLRSNYVAEEESQGDHENVLKEQMSGELDEYQYQKQRHHVVPYHHRHNHYHPHKMQMQSHHHPSVSINYHSKHPHRSTSNPTVTYRDDNSSISNISSTSVYDNHYQAHRHHANTRGPSNHHHRIISPSMMSATSSNSSLVNHGSSPMVGDNAISSSAASTSPATLMAEDQQDESPCEMTIHPNRHHLANSSNASYDSSSSNANLRSHSRLDHIPEHMHHHHGRVQHAQKGLRERLEHSADTVESPPTTTSPTPPSMNHHINQHHNHNTATNKGGQTKNTGFIGFNGMQVSSVPSKSKCQCHTLQEGCRAKRETECRNNGDVDVTSITHQPPALPPRPPPRTTRRYETVPTNHGHGVEGACCKKYVILCSLCGGLSAAVGSLFLAVHAVLSAHTASLALFETIPSYIPGTMLIIMGFFTMLLARRKHRCGLLMKVCGSVGVVCALVCVLVTVTTTVVHMSRLQGLRECVYTVRARSCTCYEAPQSKGDPGVLFEGTPHCDVVHGALYACLRALFGVSVAGILACIFSCMLVYQLLSHEKKKMYWEQLELRCRSLYGPGMGVTGVSSAVPGSCGCCNDCGGGTGSWWTQTQGNLYTPNPDLAPSRRWRLPWSRSRGPVTNPDSNYGFHTQSRQESNADNTVGPYSVLSSQAGGPYSVLNTQTSPYTTNPATYSVLETPVPLWGPPPPYSDPNSPARRPPVSTVRQQRITKRIDNYDNNEAPVDYRVRVTNKRPSDNYENAEDLANSTDPEGGNDGTVKSRRIRKPLKGVENCAFQQEANTMPKQSESELYFGDVSSCCGPESSFYDVALDNEAEHEENKDHMPSHASKRQQSKKFRQPLSIRPNMSSNSYANNEDPRNARTSYLAPDAQYEVIQQGNYAYYTPKSDDECDVVEDPKRREQTKETNTDKSKLDEGNCARQEIRDSKRKNFYQMDKNRDNERKNKHHMNEQCCLNNDNVNAEWQNTEQTQSLQESGPCHSNNV